MKKLVSVSILLVSSLLAGLAQAQTENMMGVYFDEAGTINCIENVPDLFDVFLVLHNPTFEAIDGFACHVQVQGPCMFLSGTYNSSQVFNVCDPPGHICAVFGEPLPTIETTWLIRWLMFRMEEETIGFTLTGGMGSPDPLFPAILVGSESYLATVDPGVGDGFVARIGDCTVPTAPRTFDFLKALYR